MRGEVVAIDLETTGLDPQTDEIIEVGAVRMKDGEVIAEFEMMVNPGRAIPAHTTHITGIRQEDVTNADKISVVLPKIAEFIGDAPVIAHNISLDIGFLRDRHRILLTNANIDTYDLATVLLPSAPRYNLNSLTQEMGIELEHAHRALDDARATALLYWAFWQRIVALPHHVLEEIADASTGLNWASAVVFESALRDSTTSVREQQEQRQSPFKPMNELPVTLHPKSSTTRLDGDQVAMILDDDGLLAERIPNYESRSQQIEMTRAILDAFNNGYHTMIEADTGTGKTLAYLLPSVMWAQQNHERVVISTNTINLQDQINNKDIPTLRNALETDFNAAVIKGRSNYLCPRRLASIRRRKPTSSAELMTFAKILIWLLDSQSGDRSEINLRGPEEAVAWERLSAQDEACTLHRCETTMNGACPFYKARKRAEAAHILIVNHALLVSDATGDNAVLPEYNYAIIDEAHHLENAITRSTTFHLDQTELIRRASELGSPERGLLYDLVRTIRQAGVLSDVPKFEQYVAYIEEATRAMRVHVRRLFDSLLHFVDDVQGRRDFTSIVQLDEATRTRSSFAEAQSRWNTLHEFFEVISKALKAVNRALKKIDPARISNYEDFANSTHSAARYFEDVRTRLHQFMQEPSSNAVYWISASQGNAGPVMHIAPLHVGPMLEHNLWHSKRSVVLTSGTLRTQGSFDYIKDRLYADTLDTRELDTTFNYRDSTLVYLPSDIPEPTDRHGYQRAVEKGIIELAAALQGRVLVLFTSFSQLRQTSQAVTPRLALGNITVYDQSDGSSRQALLDGFVNTEKAVLMGTRSFWEGIDIPGTDLSALIMVRLPFAVPSEPVFAARSATYAESFRNYAVPDAILRFRQGFGRLIRSTSDRGVVTIFDSRVINKGYGMQFLDALPDCTTRTGPLADLPKAAVDWLSPPAK